MPLVDHNVFVEITGTKKSVILDPEETQEIIFKKGEELRADFQNLNDLLDHILETSFRNGDAIFKLLVDDEDVIKNEIKSLIIENGWSLDDAWPEVCGLPFLANADPSDVYDFIQELSIH
jgi:hypothetical protein